MGLYLGTSSISTTWIMLWTWCMRPHPDQLSQNCWGSAHKLCVNESSQRFQCTLKVKLSHTIWTSFLSLSSSVVGTVLCIIDV